MTAPAEVVDRPLRVLFLASYFPKPLNPLMGVWALAQAQALAREGVDLRVVSFTSWLPRSLAKVGRVRAWAECPPAHDWDGLRVEYPRWLLYYHVGPLRGRFFRNPAPQMRLAWLSARRALRRIVREHRPDVVLAHNAAVNGYLAWRLRRDCGIPYVTMDWDFDEIADCERYPARRALVGKVLAGAGCAVAVAKRMEALFRRLFPGVPTTTIHSGVQPVPPRLWDVPRPAELEGKLVAFSAGIFYSRKGIPLLVEAFARAAGRHPNAVLRIAGDGDERPKVEEAIRRLGLEGRVQLLGRQPNERVLQEMVWSDVFLLIGWDEPFATVYMEAMAAGKPVVCANDGGVNDLLRDGVHGRSVPPRDAAAAGDALDALLSDPAARERMGRAARALFDEHLRSDRTARALVAACRRAIARAP
jgi:glycosyltransferase involved in cell wall biosynthesis